VDALVGAMIGVGSSAMGADVIVVGLGTMGSAAVEVLSRRGVGVVGIDRWAPPHERGEHAGGSRIIRLAYAEGTSYVPLLRRSYELWEDLQHRAQTRLLTTTGGLTIGAPESSLVAGVLASAEAHGIDCERLDEKAMAERFPQFRLADGEAAVFDPAAGVLAPEAAIDSCLSIAEVAGARLMVDTLVTGWRATPSGVTVSTSAGEVTGDRLVLCPGPGAPALLADLEVPWRVQRRLQHFWAPEGGSSLYEPGKFPVWMWESPAGLVGYGLPRQDPPGGTKAAFHDADDPADFDAGAAPATVAESQVVREWLAPRLPDLGAGEWLGATACMYTLTPDEDFVVGRHPAHDNVAVAAGFSGHGFKFLPVMGEILADLAVGGATEHPIGVFDPARYGATP
jgi:sarcosine oxidase